LLPTAYLRRPGGFADADRSRGLTVDAYFARSQRNALRRESVEGVRERALIHGWPHSLGAGAIEAAVRRFVS
jgi:hypothetical protein